MTIDTGRYASRVKELHEQGRHELAAEMALQLIAISPPEPAAPAAVAVQAAAGAAPAPAADDTWTYTEMKAWTAEQMADARENHEAKLERSMKALGQAAA